MKAKEHVVAVEIACGRSILHAHDGVAMVLYQHTPVLSVGVEHLGRPVGLVHGVGQSVGGQAPLHVKLALCTVLLSLHLQIEADTVAWFYIDFPGQSASLGHPVAVFVNDMLYVIDIVAQTFYFRGEGGRIAVAVVEIGVKPCVYSV